MSAKSTMEELRELNVRRQREAQHADEQDALAPTVQDAFSAGPTNDKMIILSNEDANDKTNDNSHLQLNELSKGHKNTHSSMPAHIDGLVPANEVLADAEGSPPAASQPVPRQPAKGRGRAGQKASLSATDRLFAQTAREPIMRLNIELTESMHTQLKQYCVLHKVPIRLLVTALIEDFFAKESEGQ